MGSASLLTTSASHHRYLFFCFSPLCSFWRAASSRLSKVERLRLQFDETQLQKSCLQLNSLWFISQRISRACVFVTRPVAILYVISKEDVYFSWALDKQASSNQLRPGKPSRVLTRVLRGRRMPVPPIDHSHSDLVYTISYRDLVWVLFEIERVIKFIFFQFWIIDILYDTILCNVTALVHFVFVMRCWNSSSCWG